MKIWSGGEAEAVMVDAGIGVGRAEGGKDMVSLDGFEIEVTSFLRG